MKGKLSGEEVLALADTGAEGGNLMSYDYAKRRGWLTNDLFGERNLLQFPDGSQSRTEGQVRKVWRYHGTQSSELSLPKLPPFIVPSDRHNVSKKYY